MMMMMISPTPDSYPTTAVAASAAVSDTVPSNRRKATLAAHKALIDTYIAEGRHIRRYDEGAAYESLRSFAQMTREIGQGVERATLRHHLRAKHRDLYDRISVSREAMPEMYGEARPAPPNARPLIGLPATPADAVAADELGKYA